MTFSVENRRLGPRGLYRKTPERILIDEEDGRAYATDARAGRLCPEREALITAIAAYAAVVGWPDAKSFLAARAHFDPTTLKRRDPSAAAALFAREEAA